MSARFALAVLVASTLGCRSQGQRERHPPSEPYWSTNYNSEAGPPPDVAAETPQAGPGGVPLPADAVQFDKLPDEGGTLAVFDIPRGVDVVLSELRDRLATDGWTIDADVPGTQSGAILTASKGDTTVELRISVVGTGTEVMVRRTK